MIYIGDKWNRLERKSQHTTYVSFLVMHKIFGKVTVVLSFKEVTLYFLIPSVFNNSLIISFISSTKIYKYQRKISKLSFFFFSLEKACKLDYLLFGLNVYISLHTNAYIEILTLEVMILGDGTSGR